MEYFNSTKCLENVDIFKTRKSSCVAARCTQVRIQDLVGEGHSQLLRPKIVGVAKQSRVPQLSHLWSECTTGVQCSMLKCAFSHILEILFLSFLTFTSIPKMDKNRAPGSAPGTAHCIIKTELSIRGERGLYGESAWDGVALWTPQYGGSVQGGNCMETPLP